MVSEQDKEKDQQEEGRMALSEEAMSEGGQSGGEDVRAQAGMPDTAPERQKWGLHHGRAAGAWEWQAGRQYGFDFFNPYLDFNNFALKLPGFSLGFTGYLDGNDYLRYTLKNKDSGEVYFVVVFTLLKKEEMDEEVVRKVEEAHEGVEVEKEDEGEGNGEGHGGQGTGVETSADDVD